MGSDSPMYDGRTPWHDSPAGHDPSAPQAGQALPVLPLEEEDAAEELLEPEELLELVTLTLLEEPPVLLPVTVAEDVALDEALLDALCPMELLETVTVEPWAPVVEAERPPDEEEEELA